MLRGKGLILLANRNNHYLCFVEIAVLEGMVRFHTSRIHNNHLVVVLVEHYSLNIRKTTGMHP